MKKNILVFGLVMGALQTGFMLWGAISCYNNPEHHSNDVVGYAGLLLIMSLIFVGVKNFRDKHNGGIITFGKAFKTGLFISLVASAVYLITSIIYIYGFAPDFIDKYVQHVMFEAKRAGADAKELAETAKSMAEFKENYKNPVFMMVTTLMEALVPGLIVALITAAILRRKTAPQA